MDRRLTKRRRRLLSASYVLDHFWCVRAGAREFPRAFAPASGVAAGKEIRIDCPTPSFTAAYAACESKSNGSGLPETALSAGAGRKPIRNPVAALRTRSPWLTRVTLVRPSLETLQRPLRKVAFCLNLDGSIVSGSLRGLYAQR